jgi:hypothetical protein
MLVNYYEFFEKSVEAIGVLTGDLKKHLREVTAFGPIFSGDIYRTPGYQGNLAVDFIRTVKSAKGFTYWDDFLEELSGEDSSFYDEFVESFNSLHERVRAKVAKGYVSGTRYNPGSVLRFLVIIGENARSEAARDVFNAISRLYVDELTKLPGGTISLAYMLHAYPEALNSFLALLEWDSLARIVELAHKEPAVPGPFPVRQQLSALADVHYESSHFFKRHFHQIIARYPAFIRNLHDNDKLREVTNGFYSDLTSIPSLNERIERLGDYYDLEFVRVSLLAMAGADCERTDAEFIEFCDNYTLLLYEYCQQDVHLSLGYSLHTRDRFALYATGGHAREQGFDDDYDMIVVLDSTDTDEIDYCNKIIGKMNTHILRRGILPHHRFADEFGSYVIRLDQLAEFLSGGGDDIFVDQSQILSSRMLVGSNKLEQRLQQEVISPLIFARAQEYIEYMRNEMISRHASGEDQRSDIKECPGGLRDIEMLLLMYEVKHKVREPLSRRFLRRLIELEPNYADELAQLENHLNFIKNLRDLYRLKVAAHNVIDQECLPPVAVSMGYGEGPEAAGKLYNDLLDRTKEAARVIGILVENINR